MLAPKSYGRRAIGTRHSSAGAGSHRGRSVLSTGALSVRDSGVALSTPLARRTVTDTCTQGRLVPPAGQGGHGGRGCGPVAQPRQRPANRDGVEGGEHPAGPVYGDQPGTTCGRPGRLDRALALQERRSAAEKAGTVLFRGMDAGDLAIDRLQPRTLGFGDALLRLAGRRRAWAFVYRCARHGEGLHELVGVEGTADKAVWDGSRIAAHHPDLEDTDHRPIAHPGYPPTVPKRTGEPLPVRSISATRLPCLGLPR